jgi:hypothetical protein
MITRLGFLGGESRTAAEDAAVPVEAPSKHNGLKLRKSPTNEKAFVGGIQANGRRRKCRALPANGAMRRRPPIPIPHPGLRSCGSLKRVGRPLSILWPDPPILQFCDRVNLQLRPHMTSTATNGARALFEATPGLLEAEVRPCLPPYCC